ncbi:protein-disulfide reductase DsbD [Pelodictyon luteolum]|uniref:Protein-disulfide reductase n=1 Tax=Chlorobium luteolum (strain DSM 273 / BCRC 81028 / 2530) TaxID=319225 RepID=Q3B5H7_CHLL3|nr:protein-disulfide reductase DsbD [Pelodictyon luteolum]ABB23404.1 Protein-disulfide reductase [Pelodictyon luteolum DSM 273]
MKKGRERSGMFRAWSLVLLLALSGIVPAAWSALHAAGPADPSSAFRLRGELLRNGSVSLRWEIAEGYKLYGDQVRLEVDSGSVSMTPPVLPEGEQALDPLTGEAAAVYHDSLRLTVPFTATGSPFVLRVWHQGCADEGICYPPAATLFRIDPEKPGPLRAEAGSAGFGVLPASPSASFEPPSDTAPSPVMATLMEGSLWKIGAVFFVFGLLLSLTPCILPMLPILSSIIAGEASPSRSRGLLLALVYSAGMAVVYTGMGVAAGLAGEGLAGFLQQPPVLLGFAFLLILLSLSMFDLYQLQIPASLQKRLNSASVTLKGGRFPGVFLMGAISALVIGPCVAAPLAGTLIFISQTGDLLLGGMALFSMAAGMSVPLLLLGLSAGFLLPRAGGWMVAVKYLFGILLIAVAINMASPVLPPPAVMTAWAMLLVLAAYFLGVFQRSGGNASSLNLAGRATGFLCLLLAAVMVFGAATGARSPGDLLRVLGGTAVDGRQPALQFLMISSDAELDRELRDADRPVMLDFSADWCVSCRELEHITFRDPEVAAALGRMRLLRVDVTRHTPEDRRLMKRFGVFGPPALVFFDSKGRELSGLRVDGFIAPKDLLELIRRP